MNQSLRTFSNTRLSFDILAPYALLHLACFAALATGISWRAVGICLGSFFLRAFGLGVGYHRYFAHKSFKTSRPMQFLLAVLGNLAPSARYFSDLSGCPGSVVATADQIADWGAAFRQSFTLLLVIPQATLGWQTILSNSAHSNRKPKCGRGNAGLRQTEQKILLVPKL